MATWADREFVTERADSRCEYCRAPQVVTGITFHIEHIIPRASGGANHRSNYALSCIACNSHKSDHVTGIDPQTATEVPLYHPRREKWGSHFRFVPGTLRIHGLTSLGRATVARLQMNAPKQVLARALWMELGIYP